MYFKVLAGSCMVGLGSDEISPIAEKRLAPLFGQSFVLAKIITPKLSDHDLNSFACHSSAERANTNQGMGVG